MDTEGHLLAFYAVPPEVPPSTGTASSPDWTAFFAEAGLDISQWTPVDARWSPWYFADTRIAWQGSLPNQPDTIARIEAAAFQGKAVFFRIIRPWTRAVQMEPVRQMTGQHFVTAVSAVIGVSLIACAIFFALRNLRLGRGDRRSATRLAFLIAGIAMISWILSWHHVQTYWEFTQFFLYISASLITAGVFWLLYIAIEPFVRRRWPRVLVSWTRLLSGDWRDPLVARDALIGCSFGVLICGIYNSAHFLFPSWFGIAEPRPPLAFALRTVLGANFFISEILDLIFAAIGAGLMAIGLLFLLSVLLRNQKAAIAACVLILALIEGPNYWGIAIGLVVYPVGFFVLMRFGLVAGILSFALEYLIERFPIGLDTSAWYSGTGYAARCSPWLLSMLSVSRSAAARSSPPPALTTDFRRGMLYWMQAIWPCGTICKQIGIW